MASGRVPSTMVTSGLGTGGQQTSGSYGACVMFMANG
jgi:hypothetical protein